MKTIIPQYQEEFLDEAAAALKKAKKVVALTGAGISVASGIPDFRSADGLWTVFAPDEYATLEVFRHRPDKAWQLFRALGRILIDRQPNPAHQVLADLEEAGLVQGIITQNIDRLHQAAGSRTVFEIHGEHEHLHCLRCDWIEETVAEHYTSTAVPLCPECDYPLKPNIVLFGETVRRSAEINFFIADCDLLLVIGTSAEVYPAAGLPGTVKRNGGMVFEFNRQPVLAVAQQLGRGQVTDYFFGGDLGVSLPLFGQAGGRP